MLRVWADSRLRVLGRKVLSQRTAQCPRRAWRVGQQMAVARAHAVILRPPLGREALYLKPRASNRR